MGTATLQQILAITEEQEKLLRVDHFTNKDALDLGNFLVQKIYDNKLNFAVSIRRLNGAIIFQHMTAGTKLNNQKWMQRKFNTAILMERSSLGMWAMAQIKGDTLASHGLNDADYVFCGGAFPIRLKTGEIVAVLVGSNFPHIEDHNFLVKSLAEWLDVKNCPEIKL